LTSRNGSTFASSKPSTVKPENVALPEGTIHSRPFSGEFIVFNMMVYAEVGEGKTPLLGSVVDVPEMMPALLIDGDAGTLSIREIDNLDTIHLLELAASKSCDAWTALEFVYNFLCRGEHAYKTVMLDGGTDIERFCEENILSNASGNRADRDTEMAELGDFRRIQERMKRMYTRFRDLRTIDRRRVNFIAAAHESKGKDPITLKPVVQPMFIGKGAVLMPSRFDIVARLVTKEEGGKPVKYLVPSLEGRSRGRDRSKTLGREMKDPNMSKIAEAIFSKQEVK